VLDSFGTWLAASPEHPPQSPGPPDASLVAEWRDWLGQADYVVLTTPGSTRIPWTPALRRFFARTFVSVSNPPGAAIYRRSDNALLTAARAG
jgi:hypothetical protein